ncbi:MAG: copper resistance protein CopC [Candidatus Bipolaricaulota bacterium]|nr:copper resistance protein CopC [Candidatus Bipolaricaulota bacterium]
MAKRWYGLALGCILVWALVVSWATGHPRLRVADTVPPPGALLTEPPKEVKLVFSVEPGGLIPDQSLFWVVRQGPDEVVVVGRVDLTVADRNVMRAELKERLVPGVYLVKWVAVSLQDKGFAEGSYSFAVK